MTRQPDDNVVISSGLGFNEVIALAGRGGVDMTKTLMEAEASESSQLIARQLERNATQVTTLGETLRAQPPAGVMIVGRGSSDHAGVYGKYLIEIELGVPVYPAAPSVASVYGRKLQLENFLVIAISQSGRSPDILAQAEMAKDAGARVIALVNDEGSPLKDIADYFIPLHAGEEKSVAATKSYLCTLSALAHITAEWANSDVLRQGLTALPEALDETERSASQLTVKDFEGVANLVVLGRGLGFAVSKEVALKLKEVCSIHAEAFSSAEFLHGPVTLVEQSLTIIDLHIDDESAQAHNEQILEVTSRGARVIPLKQTSAPIHPRLAPLSSLLRFYIDIANVAVGLGFSPDEPKGLKKVTKTR